MADSFKRIGAVFETAKEMTIEAASSASAALAESGTYRPRDIKKCLNSKHENDKLNGMKAIALLMSSGEDVTEYFPEVVKNSSAQTLEVRKLVYIYLLRNAEKESDLALLSINAIQKSLSDQNPQIRAMAIKVLSGIKVPSIAPIILISIRKCIVDLSSVVRRAAAVAIAKAYELDSSHLETLVGYLTTLLADKSFYVIGTAVQTFEKVCPDRLDMLHANYRRYCSMLADIDEWGQVSVINTLVRYVRVYVSKGKMVKRAKDTFYSDDEEEEEQQQEADGNQQHQLQQAAVEDFVIDPDLELLLAAAKPLLQSRNSAVVISVVNLFSSLVPEADLSFLGPPLVRLLSTPPELQYVILTNIVVLALQNRDLFGPYLKYFYVFPSDTSQIAKLKIEVLTLSCSEDTVGIVLSELQYYATSLDKDLVAEAVRAIGRCAQVSKKFASKCLRWLLKQIHSTDAVLVGESLTVIRYIIQMDPLQNVKAVAKLANSLDGATVGLARASIIWLVGEFAGVARNIAPDVLRKCAKTFTGEEEITRLQIVLLAAKLYSYFLEDRGDFDHQQRDADLQEENEQLRPTVERTPDTMDLLFDYIMLLARYDTSYDLRDRARLYKSILSSPGANAGPIAKLILQAPKPSPHAPSPSEGRERFEIGTTSAILGLSVQGYRPLPDWSLQTPDSSIRDDVPDQVEQPPITTIVISEKPSKRSSQKIKIAKKKQTRDGLASERKKKKKKAVKVSEPSEARPVKVAKEEPKPEKKDYHTTLDEFFGQPAAPGQEPEIDDELLRDESSSSEEEVVIEVEEEVTDDDDDDDDAESDDEDDDSDEDDDDSDEDDENESSEEIGDESSEADSDNESESQSSEDESPSTKRLLS
ncbi:adaptin N terminal region-domain-containing protein [Lipomyces japonicus]|uniref:adaptin N terminal region-domain-containing protein n=1 Tax=Lipomyces japonicus TaxID=56871 RepID=UPI0034CFA717